MNGTSLDEMTDEDLVDYFKKWAVEQGKSFVDVEKNNKIDAEMLMPCFDALARRGSNAVNKLVALTQDDNPNVRKNAADFAFNADPATCRRVLLELMKRRDPLALFAWMSLARNDPQSAPSPSVLYNDSPRDTEMR